MEVEPSEPGLTYQYSVTTMETQNLTAGELGHTYTFMDSEGTILQSINIDGDEIHIEQVEECDEVTVPIVAAAECSNCLQEFGPGRELSTCFLIQGDVDSNTQETPLIEVNAFDALNHVFRWRAFGIVFQRYNGEKIQFEEDEIALCKNCVGFLAELYNAIRSFDAVTAHDSKVQHLNTTLLDTIVNLANSTDREIEKEQTKSNSSSKFNSPEKPKSTTKFVPYNQDSQMVSEATKYTAEDLIVGLDYDENTIPVLKCTMTARSTLKGHRKKKDNEITAYICQLCSGTFKKRNNLSRHLLLTHDIGPAREKKFKCGHCHRAFHFGYLLKSHMKSHSEERPFNCPQCPKKFKAKDGLVHHIKDVHRETKNRPRCRLCWKSFKQERSLQEHAIMIHGLGKTTAQTVVPCPNCDSRFKRKRSMLAHLRKGQCNSKRVLKKTNIQPNIQASSPRKIIIRKRERETDMTEYPCPFNCGKQFARKSSMMSHASHFCQLKPKEEFEFGEELEDSGEYEENFEMKVTARADDCE